MRDNNPSCRQQVLDHSQTERKTEIEPDSMGDDLGGKAVAAVEWVTLCRTSVSKLR